MKEIPLKGGRSTDGVVRVGDTLRRPHKQESEFVNSVLKYLEEQGYPYSQRYLGLDECSRDIGLQTTLSGNGCYCPVLPLRTW